MDELISWVTARAPRIERISVTGFSAGAQMILRWAIMSPEGIDGTTKTGIALRIVVGDPSFYTYLDDERPDESCRSFSADTVSNYSCDGWVVPESKTCEGDWNDYQYGLASIGLSACSDSTSEACAVSHYALRLATNRKAARGSDSSADAS